MKIAKAEYMVSSPNARACPKVHAPEYAFIGRSNVGKSSLINMLTGRRGLAKTSQTPGKTLLINHFSIDNGAWYIVDLPGYGFALRGKKQREQLSKMIFDYVDNRCEMTMLFVLIDSRHAPQKIDLEFMSHLGEHSVPFAIIFTKTDKQSASATHANIEAYKKALLNYWEELPPIFATSSTKGRGREEILDYIESINKSISEQNEEKIPESEDAVHSEHETPESDK